MKRKTAQEVADENLATAERVEKAAVKRLAKAEAAFEKAAADAKMAGRKLAAARLVALDEDLIEPEVTAAAPAADNDVL